MNLDSTTTRRSKAARLRIEGGLLFAPSDLQFDPGRPYTYCRICGVVYQEPRDRQAYTIEDTFDRMMIRKAWSHNHAKSHSEREHAQLQSSGLWCTPEAANKLASYGIHAIGSGVLSEEHRAALLESSSLPNNDCEGS
jgi:hypothetical protein